MKSLLSFLFLSTLFLFSFASTDFEEEENVIVLTESNFDSVIATHEFILVEFYAPWCGHCKKLAPEYAAAATTLKNNGETVRLAKVDATVHSSLGSKFGIRGYPTLKFFKGGNPIEYNGGRTKSDIISWVKKHSGPAARTLTTKEEAEKFKETENVSVLAYFEKLDSEDANAFQKIANQFDDISFAFTNNKEAFEAVSNGASQVVLFKNFDEKVAAFSGDFSKEAVSTWIQENSIPLVFEFNEATSQKIFGSAIKDHFFLFVSSKEAPEIEELRKTSAALKGKAIFTYFDVNSPVTSRVVEYFKISKSALPDARFLVMEDDMAKYKPDSKEATSENWIAFVQSILDGTHKKYLMSAEPVAYSGKGVRDVVGSEHDTVAFDETKNVLLEYYAPWCGHCKNLAPIYEQLASLFDEVENVVVAKMDSTANEADGLVIKGFPTLKFYPAGSRSVVDYNGDRSLADLSKFILDNSVGLSEEVKQKVLSAQPKEIDSLEEEEDYEEEFEEEEEEEEEEVHEEKKEQPASDDDDDEDEAADDAEEPAVHRPHGHGAHDEL